MPSLLAIQFEDYAAQPLPATVLHDLQRHPVNLRFLVWGLDNYLSTYRITHCDGITSAVPTAWPRPTYYEWVRDWTNDSVYDHLAGIYDY